MAEKAEKYDMPLTAAEIVEKLSMVKSSETIADETIKRLSDNGQIGYEEETPVEVIPETTLEFVPFEDMGGIPVALFEVETKACVCYSVKLDGVEYVRVADENGVIGNKGLAGEEDTGEPFLIVVGAIIAATDGAHTISVTEHATTIHTVAKKWLPAIPKESKLIYVNKLWPSQFYEPEPYDFWNFAESGVHEFYATCAFAGATGLEQSQSFSVKFTACSINDERVLRYISTPVFDLNLGSSKESFVVEIDIHAREIDTHQW